MTDEALERVVFGQTVRLPNMSKLERSSVLSPVLRAIVDASAKAWGGGVTKETTRIPEQSVREAQQQSG